MTLTETLELAVAPAYRPLAAVKPDGGWGLFDVAAALRSRGALAASEGDGIVGLAPADAADADLIVEGCTISIGSPVVRGELTGPLDDARALARLAARWGIRGRVPDDALPLERLLAASPVIAARLREAAIDPLAAHDEAHGSELVETLRAFLLAGRGRRRAAEALGIHPNTLRQRLARIEELTGLAVADRPYDVVVAALAVKALRSRL